MGGGEHGHVEGGGDFRAKVWSMSGGPYCRPKHWRRNTAFALFGIFLVCVPVAMKSAQLEIVTASDGKPIRSAVKSFPRRTVYDPSHVAALKAAPDTIVPPRPPDQRPHEPVRPIPSQMWCKNFGNKEY